METPKVWKRGGPGRPVAERFWEKVDKSGGDDACWNWMAADIGNGYGTFAETPYKRTLAHRMAWRLKHGELLPDGMDLCHKCDNRLCCNPAHLFVGTRADNLRDCREKKRHTYGEKSPHAKLTERNVHWMREWRSAGWPLRLLAAVLQIDPSTASEICAGKKWRASFNQGQ